MHTSCCCRRCAAGAAYTPLRSVSAATKQGVIRISSLVNVSTCKLCGNVAELQQSHLIPKSIYRILKNEYEGGGLVIGRSDKKSIAYSDMQVKMPLLCSSCEERFNKFGENTVTKECYRTKDSFALLDKLKNYETIDQITTESWTDPRKVDENLKVDAYSYFALSVVWRASVERWPIGLENCYGALREKYEFDIRQYLSGKTDFPKNMYLGVYVNNDINPVSAIMFPTVKRKHGYHHYHFHIPGLKFSLLIGNYVGTVKEMAEIFQSKIFFVRYSFREHGDFELLHKNIKFELQPKGRLCSERENV
jgi:hypothetical protein